MLNKISCLLSAADLSEVRRLLGGAHFADGRLSAAMHAQRGKRNHEVCGDAATLKALHAIVMPKLIHHPDYQAIALPAKIAEPFYVAYRKGDYYADHTDNPVMGRAPHLYRSDIAMTIFLNDPDEYDGGELRIATLPGEHTLSAKYPAGDAVLYPATTTHRVESVTSGQRLVAVTWVQSLIPNPEQRALLHRLGGVRDSINAADADSDAAKQLEWLYTTLFRMWTQL